MKLYAVLVALASACSSSAGHVAMPTPTIVVLERGAEPRQRLRYEPAPGLVEELELDTKIRVTNRITNTALETGKLAVDLPTSIITGRLQVTGQSPEGQALVSWAVEDVRTLEDAADPPMLRLVATQIRGLRGSHASWRLMPSGELADIKLDMPNMPEAMRARASTLSDSFDAMFVRFPDAYIGVGATWQIESQFRSAGVNWVRKATYTLRELTDQQAIVDVSVAMRAPSQDLRVEPNRTTTLKSGEGTVSGQVFVPRQGLVASGSIQAATEASFLIVSRHLRISSTLRTEIITAVKRIDASPSVVQP